MKQSIVRTVLPVETVEVGPRMVDFLEGLRTLVVAGVPPPWVVTWVANDVQYAMSVNGFKEEPKEEK